MKNKIQILLILLSFLNCTKQELEESVVLKNLIKITNGDFENTCKNGGIKIETGLDQNLNNLLDLNEVTNTQYICNGIDGNNGIPILTKVTKILISENCENGGFLIEFGQDLNNDQTLNLTEITNSIEICNGNNLIETAPEDITSLQGEKMADVGDSILNRNGIQPIIINRFGILNNDLLSISGAKIIEGSNSICNQIKTITNNPKLILIGGGTNDFGYNSKLGNLDSENTSEYAGALKFILNYAITNYPNSNIIKIGIPFGDWQTSGGSAKGQVNSLGLTRFDYVKIEKEICSNYGITYVNCLEDLNWNLQNIEIKTIDRIHPSSEGNKDIADLISEKINKVFK